MFNISYKYTDTMLSDLLLDISTDKFSHFELEESFDKVAIELLRNTKLISGKNHYVIKEIEFYFVNDHYRHLDPYTHKSSRQLLFGQWYFHRFKSVQPYHKLKFKGVDITFGSKRHNTFGGILIRKIQNIDTNEVVDGIGRIVSRLMEDLGDIVFENVATNDIPMKVFDNTSPLHLAIYPNSINSPVFKTTRKNLGEASLNELKYFDKMYNYFNDVNYILVG